MATTLGTKLDVDEYYGYMFAHSVPGLLERAASGDPLIEVPLAWLDDARLRAGVQHAHKRGARLVARGDTTHSPPDDVARCFHRRMTTLSAAKPSAVGLNGT